MWKRVPGGSLCISLLLYPLLWKHSAKVALAHVLLFIVLTQQQLSDDTFLQSQQKRIEYNRYPSLKFECYVFIPLCKNLLRANWLAKLNHQVHTYEQDCDGRSLKISCCILQMFSLWKTRHCSDYDWISSASRKTSTLSWFLLCSWSQGSLLGINLTDWGISDFMQYAFYRNFF